MAIRYELHENHLEDFERWLKLDGWSIEVPKSEYEVLRATKKGKKRPLLVYKTLKEKSEHLSFADEFRGIVKQFIKQKDMPIDCRGCEHFSIKTTKCKLHGVKASEVDIMECKMLDDIAKDFEDDMNAVHFGDEQW